MNPLNIGTVAKSIISGYFITDYFITGQLGPIGIAGLVEGLGTPAAIKTRSICLEERLSDSTKIVSALSLTGLLTGITARCLASMYSYYQV